MAWRSTVLSWMVCLFVTAAVGQEPAVAPKATVEFRWLAGKPIQGVTEEKGIRTTCWPALSYPHVKPVLTNTAVAGAVLKTYKFSTNDLSVRYMVEFQLTEAARKTLVAEAGTRATVELATFVDGQYWGTAYFRKAEVATFTPSAGLISSKAEADRIVEAFK
jgi:hypothetical protein